MEENVVVGTPVAKASLDANFRAIQDDLDELYARPFGIGAIGSQGDVGPQGPQGDTGPQGPQGDKGDIGVTGDSGPQGVRGLKGDTGTTGATGPQGPIGDAGPQGIQGLQGDKGDKGDIGVTGPQGIQGVKGDTGTTGPQGIQGPQGEVGPQGIQGVKGDTGTTGATGPQGPIGDTGAAGTTNYNELSNKPSIPSTLADLSSDSSHQVVTSSQITTWSAKQDTLTADTDYLAPATAASEYLTQATAASTYVPKSDPQLLAFHLALHTGWLSGGVISINGSDPTAIDITACTTRYVDNSNPSSPVLDTLACPQQTAIVPPSLATSNRLWIGVQRTSAGVGSIVFSTTFTPVQKRTVAIIGRVWSNSSPTISGIGQYKTPAWGTEKTLEDLVDTLGSINRSGNIFGANSGSLTLSKSSGSSFRFTGYSATNPDAENIIFDAAIPSIATYNYHVAQGANGTVALLSAIDPNNYDVSGVGTTVPSGLWTIQRIYQFPNSEVIDIVYGQETYSSLAEAVNNVSLENVSISANHTTVLYGSMLRGWICVQQGTTDLSDPLFCSIIPNIGLGGGGASGSASTTIAAGSTGQVQVNSGNTFVAYEDFAWSPTYHSLNLGKATILPGNPLALSGSYANTIQVNIQNKLTDPNASSDFVATADIGDNNNNYIDLGINSSTYSQSGFSATGPLDGYLYVQGGNLAIGTATEGMVVNINVGGTQSSNVVGTFDADGINLVEGCTFRINGTPLSIQGPQGIQGIQGVKGDTGSQGIQGVKGDTGAAGTNGVDGATGPQGIQGVKGDTGSQGVKGDTGTAGTNGVDGATGPQGVKGDTGTTGSQGIQGVKGDTGAAGTDGVDGATGPQGIQGVKGDTGATGATGQQGTVSSQSVFIQDTDPGTAGLWIQTNVNGDPNSVMLWLEV